MNLIFSQRRRRRRRLAKLSFHCRAGERATSSLGNLMPTRPTDQPPPGRDSKLLGELTCCLLGESLASVKLSFDLVATCVRNLQYLFGLVVTEQLLILPKFQVLSASMNQFRENIPGSLLISYKSGQLIFNNHY